jgi:hypothetical protein
MTAHDRSQIHKGIELLQLTCACDGQQAGDRRFPILAAIAKTNLPPLSGVTRHAFRDGMPRAGLCRVGVNRTPLLGADLLFAFGDVSA